MKRVVRKRLECVMDGDIFSLIASIPHFGALTAFGAVQITFLFNCSLHFSIVVCSIITC